ncbi:PepSY-associated TM helix domain-containing protein [Colwelliaceae bacterium 6471]
MSTKSRPIQHRIIRHLREWHRKLGIFAAFFLIFLSVTGIALNHTNLLQLAHQPISNGILLDHYGIKSAQDIRYFNDNELSVTDNFVWLNDVLLLESDTPIISIGQFQQYYIVATTKQLHIYDLAGELVDRIDQMTGLPAEIQAVALTDNNLLINTELGYFQTDINLFEWQSIATLIEPTWLMGNDVEPTILESANQRYRSQFLTLERIIVDAHSGRIFGNFGVIFMDIVAIMLILLSLSGIYIWIRYAKAKR